MLQDYKENIRRKLVVKLQRVWEGISKASPTNLCMQAIAHYLASNNVEKIGEK